MKMEKVVVRWWWRWDFFFVFVFVECEKQDRRGEK